MIRRNGTSNRYVTPACLESLETGQRNDYDFEPYARDRKKQSTFLLVFLFCIIALPAVALGIQFCKMMRHDVSHGANVVEGAPCSWAKTSWGNVLSVSKRNISLVHPKITSTSLETFRAAETMEEPECVLVKTIHRTRYRAVTIRYVDSNRWPTGRSEYATFTDDVGVCVQHAMDVLGGIINCDSTSS